MKVIKAKEMARIEQKAYATGASEEAFMNQAGQGVAEAVQRLVARYHLVPKIILLCGSGNNAGDAYVAGKILKEGGFTVSALSFAPFEKSSPLCQLQQNRFKEAGGGVTFVDGQEEISFDEATLLVDGILGTGFHGQVEGLYRDVIELANASSIPILAIDVPSGISGTTGEIGGVAIEALETLFLGLPKTGCFLGDAWNTVGKVSTYNFGLADEFIAQAEEDFILIDDEMVLKHLPQVVRNRHKYQAGYVVGLGGSPGMPGAPIMSAFATLRSGAGIVRLLHPKGMEAELASAPYEVIRQGYEEGDVESVLQAMERAASVFVGPGMGTSEAAFQLLKSVLPHIERPCVIDAEALTLLANHPIELPPETILTPHHGEMHRLLGIEKTLPFPELLKETQAYAEKHKVTVVLKGAPTFICQLGERPHLCCRGDPGMATAGSGDVLTGVIAAFLSQKLSPLYAAALGVQFHALAGEIAAEEYTSYCLAATDLIHALPSVFETHLHLSC